MIDAEIKELLDEFKCEFRCDLRKVCQFHGCSLETCVCEIKRKGILAQWTQWRLKNENL